MGLALVTGTFYLHLLSLRWNTSCKLLLRDVVLNVSGHDKWDWPWWQEHLPWLIIIEVKYCLYITSKRYGAKCLCRLSCLCGLIYLLSNAFKLFGFPMLSVHDERYSRNVSSSLNLISTCLFVLRVCSINVSNCFSYIATTNLCRGGRPRKLKRTETETLVLGYWLEIAVDVGTSLHQWAVREFMCLIPRSTIF